MQLSAFVPLYPLLSLFVRFVSRCPLLSLFIPTFHTVAHMGGRQKEKPPAGGFGLYQFEAVHIIIMLAVYADFVPAVEIVF